MLRSLRREERASILVIVAVAIPTFILIAALALDFGNWYAHKRSLQNRVDAAAFAASVAYGFNFPACTSSQAEADNITTAAKQYAGTGATPFNGTNGDGTTILVNPDGPNPCQQHSPGDYSSPSGTMWTDVHATTKVNSLFGGFGFVPTIRANARVAVMQLQSATAFRPLAIANPDYTTGECAWAIFENARGGPVTVPLTPKGNGLWSATADIGLETKDVLVHATLGDCASAQDRVTYNQVGYIGVYDQGSSGSEPKLQDLFVSALSGNCPDGLYVSRYATRCSFQLSAEINWGNRRRAVGVSANGTQFSGAGGSWNGTLSQLSGGAGEPGIGNGTIPIRLVGRYRNLNAFGRPVGPVRTFQFGQVQSIMAGNDRHEGPISAFGLSQVSAHDNQQVSETINLRLDQLRGAQLTVLRGRGGDDGMLTGMVDCADGQSPAAEIARGCTSWFQVHAPSLCSGGSSAPPDCVRGLSYSASLTGTFNALWAPGDSCSSTPDRWSSYPNIPRGDPRLITVPVTRVGSSFAPGDDHPVVSFAAFYVTGWDGMPSGCGDQFAGATPAATASIGNAIWGHFIRFVEPSGTGAPKKSGAPANDVCPQSSTDIAACIATLVQ